MDVETDRAAGFGRANDENKTRLRHASRRPRRVLQEHRLNAVHDQRGRALADDRLEYRLEPRRGVHDETVGVDAEPFRSARELLHRLLPGDVHHARRRRRSRSDDG